MKAEGVTSKAPLKEAFGSWPNARLVLIALFGAVVGQAVVWYTGQFYALFFLEKVMRVEGATANIMIAVALLIGTPFFLFFGWLSDRIGRKKIILAGCLLAALSYFPLFHSLARAVNPALYAAQIQAPVTVIADPADCSLQFDPIGKTQFDRKSCDIAKSFLAKAGVGYSNEAAPAGTPARLRIGDALIDVPDPRVVSDMMPFSDSLETFQNAARAQLSVAGYPDKADPAHIDWPTAIAILTLFVIFVTMVYGPIAALLVELFPARIRYTSMSLPYHIGNGWFGGFLPTIAFAIVAATGNIYSGLWYPVLAVGITFMVGLLLLPETRGRRVDA
jgi:MFS family permease